jgi:hypothetical protein
MSADINSELLAYHAFVKTTLSKGGSIDEDATPAAFLEYQHQLNRLRAALQPAANRFQSGEEAAEIDVDQLVDEVLQSRLDAGEQP